MQCAPVHQLEAALVLLHIIPLRAASSRSRGSRFSVIAIFGLAEIDALDRGARCRRTCPNWPSPGGASHWRSSLNQTSPNRTAPRRSAPQRISETSTAHAVDDRRCLDIDGSNSQPQWIIQIPLRAVRRRRVSGCCAPFEGAPNLTTTDMVTTGFGDTRPSQPRYVSHW